MMYRSVISASIFTSSVPVLLLQYKVWKLQLPLSELQSNIVHSWRTPFLHETMQTYSCGVKVLFDGEAVHHAAGQALLHAGQKQHDHGKHLEVHSGQRQVSNMRLLHVSNEDSGAAGLACPSQQSCITLPCRGRGKMKQEGPIQSCERQVGIAVFIPEAHLTLSLFSCLEPKYRM